VGLGGEGGGGITHFSLLANSPLLSTSGSVLPPLRINPYFSFTLICSLIWLPPY
jgi:hypothetical protein